MIQKQKILALLIISLIIYGCKTDKKQDIIEEINTVVKTEQYTPKPKNNNIGSILSSAIKEATKKTRRVKIDSIMNDLMLIKNKSFYTMSPGDSLSTYKNVLKKERIKTGEGDLEVYNFYDEGNNKLATIHLDPSKKELIGAIHVLYNKAKTKDGIAVGMTFGDLLNKYPNIEVHGSEIEGRTYAKHENNISYLLDTNKLERSKIKRTAKIKAILIN